MSVENKVISCLGCNNEKNTLTQEEYRVVWAFRKNAIKVDHTKIFAGETNTPTNNKQIIYTLLVFILIKLVHCFQLPV